MICVYLHVTCIMYHVYIAISDLHRVHAIDGGPGHPRSNLGCNNHLEGLRTSPAGFPCRWQLSERNAGGVLAKIQDAFSKKKMFVQYSP